MSVKTVSTAFEVDFHPNPLWAMHWRVTPELIAALRSSSENGVQPTLRFEANGEHVAKTAGAEFRFTTHEGGDTGPLNCLVQLPRTWADGVALEMGVITMRADTKRELNEAEKSRVRKIAAADEVRYRGAVTMLDRAENGAGRRSRGSSPAPRSSPASTPPLASGAADAGISLSERIAAASHTAPPAGSNISQAGRAKSGLQSVPLKSLIRPEDEPPATRAEKPSLSSEAARSGGSSGGGAAAGGGNRSGAPATTDLEKQTLLDVARAAAAKGTLEFLRPCVMALVCAKVIKRKGLVVQNIKNLYTEVKQPVPGKEKVESIVDKVTEFNGTRLVLTPKNAHDFRANWLPGLLAPAAPSLPAASPPTPTGRPLKRSPPLEAAASRGTSPAPAAPSPQQPGPPPTEAPPPSSAKPAPTPAEQRRAGAAEGDKASAPAAAKVKRGKKASTTVAAAGGKPPRPKTPPPQPQAELRGAGGDPPAASLSPGEIKGSPAAATAADDCRAAKQPAQRAPPPAGDEAPAAQRGTKRSAQQAPDDDEDDDFDVHDLVGASGRPAKQQRPDSAAAVPPQKVAAAPAAAPDVQGGEPADEWPSPDPKAEPPEDDSWFKGYLHPIPQQKAITSAGEAQKRVAQFNRVHATYTRLVQLLEGARERIGQLSEAAAAAAEGGDVERARSLKLQVVAEWQQRSTYLGRAQRAFESVHAWLAATREVLEDWIESAPPDDAR